MDPPKFIITKAGIASNNRLKFYRNSLFTIIEQGPKSLRPQGEGGPRSNKYFLPVGRPHTTLCSHTTPSPPDRLVCRKFEVNYCLLRGAGGPGFLTIFPGPRFSKSNKKCLKAYVKMLPEQSLI